MLVDHTVCFIGLNYNSNIIHCKNFGLKFLILNTKKSISFYRLWKKVFVWSRRKSNKANFFRLLFGFFSFFCSTQNLKLFLSAKIANFEGFFSKDMSCKDEVMISLFYICYFLIFLSKENDNNIRNSVQEIYILYSVFLENICTNFLKICF